MAFERQDTYKKIVDIIAQELKIEPATITESSNFQDLGADSLDMVQIIMRLEELFGIEIKDEDAQDLLNVGQVADYVNGKRTK